MTREEFYSQNRDERADYTMLPSDGLAYVPLTRDGFEALCERVTSENDLILDDPVRSNVAGYIHHIPANEVVFPLEDLCKVVFKGVSNNLTFQIDQEMKLKAKKEMEEAKRAQEQPANVLPIKKDDPSGPQATS